MLVKQQINYSTWSKNAMTVVTGNDRCSCDDVPLTAHRHVWEQRVRSWCCVSEWCCGRMTLTGRVQQSAFIIHWAAGCSARACPEDGCSCLLLCNRMHLIATTVVTQYIIVFYIIKCINRNTNLKSDNYYWMAKLV